MVDIMFSNEDMQYINMAINVTKTNIIDCLNLEDRVIFIVQKGQLGAAIGTKAKNLERLRSLFKKTIKFVEFDEDKKRFICNLCKPYKVNNVIIDESNNSFVAKIEVSQSDKSKLIGRNGRNINMIRKIAQRHHPIKDVQIV